jgi:hypothetical protein
MTIMMAMVMLFPLSFVYYGRGVKVVDPYLGGANVHGTNRFIGSANQPQAVAIQNYYLHSLFSESWLARWGMISSAALLALMLGLASWSAATTTPSPKSELEQKAKKTEGVMQPSKQEFDVKAGPRVLHVRLEPTWPDLVIPGLIRVTYAGTTPVAQVSKPAVSRVSKPADQSAFDALPTWKSATQQVWKPALHHRIPVHSRLA